MTLEEVYTQVHDTFLKPAAVQLDRLLHKYFEGIKRIDRISTRAKSVDRFIDKSKKEEEGKLKYVDPMNEIQDQIGARIVTFYISDVDKVAEIVENYFRAIEVQYIVPESESEFDYIGKHFILFIPTDVIDIVESHEAAPKVFELQIKTLFQHAWSEANHDLAYKPENPLSSDQKRRVAYTAAQAWGADRMFEELQLERANS